MKNTPYTLVFFISILIFTSQYVAKGQIFDSFDDLNFTYSPSWMGDSNLFIVESGMLRLKAPAVNNTAYLSTSNLLINNTTWRFRVNMKFNPSASNYCKIYIVSDKSNVKDSVNGYFVKIGGTEDEISLYKQSGTTESRIINGEDKRVDLSEVLVDIKVERDSVGRFKLYSDVSTSLQWNLEGEIFDTSYLQTTFFGVSAVYTSTRSELFYFDNIFVFDQSYVDTVAPKIISHQFLSNSIEIDFSEPIDTSGKINWLVYNYQPVLSENIQVINSSKISVKLPSPYINGNNLLEVSNVRDVSGKIIKPLQLNYDFYHPSIFDIIITEIYPNPSNSLGLPAYEYLEIYNPTNNKIALKNWKITVNSNTYILPDSVVPPQSYAIICHKDAVNQFQPYGLAIGAISSSTAITNEGGFVSIIDTSGSVIHFIEYNVAQHDSKYKQEGGWSLEMKDVYNPCNQNNNYTSSVARNGGTPSQPNSIATDNADVTPPQIQSLSIKTDSSLIVTFTEPVYNLDNLNTNLYNVTSLGAPRLVKYLTNNFHIVALQFDKRFELGTAYTLKISSKIKDCTGNNPVHELIYSFKKPTWSEYNDVIINELLFNPPLDLPDFVEIYNRSDKAIELANLRIATRNTETKELESIFKISENGMLLMPQQYVALTTNKDEIIAYYNSPFPNAILNIAQLPPLNNTNGTIVLTDATLNVIDEFNYSEAMHHSLIKNPKGVSLERISFETPSNDARNWHSAASTVNYATPGYENSQHKSETETNQPFTVEPSIFSPNNDGLDDFTTILYNLPENGYFCTVKVFNTNGVEVITIAQNEMLGFSGFLIWNGNDTQQRKVPLGIYVVYIDIFHVNFPQKQYRIPVVVGS